MTNDSKSVLKLHWKRFAFMWAWPILFLTILFFPGFSTHTPLIFFGVYFPLMLACFYIASEPVRSKQVTMGTGVWWIMIVPLLIWIFLIFGLFGLGFLLGASHHLGG
jgi:hypothetical protein